MKSIKLENIPSLQAENIVLSDSAFVGGASISQSNADALYHAVSRE